MDGSRKDHIEWGNLDSELQMLNVLSYCWILAPNICMWIQILEQLHIIVFYHSSRKVVKSLLYPIESTDVWVLRAMWPNFGSAYEFLCNGSLQGKTHGDDLSLGKNNWTPGLCRILLGSYSLHALSSFIKLVILLAIFSFTLSVMPGKDVIISRNPIVFIHLFFSDMHFVFSLYHRKAEYGTIM